MNGTLTAWIAGCTTIRKVWGGYVFVWQKSALVFDEKELKAGQVVTRSYRGIPLRIVETTLPIEIGVRDIIGASAAIKKSGKLRK